MRLEILITHLDGLREDRKFVMVFTEGWALFRPDPGLSRGLKGPTGRSRIRSGSTLAPAASGRRTRRIQRAGA